MPALNFQKQFVRAVELGSLVREAKTWEPDRSLASIREEMASDFPDEFPLSLNPKFQTIRAYRKDGRDPKPGDTLYLFTAMRTKQCRKLGEVTCSGVVNVRVGKDSALSTSLRNAFARTDGFRDYLEMLQWFEKTHGLPFKGLLIRW